MASYTWPSTGRRRPENTTEHAACLKVDFDLVSDAVNASLSRATILPSGLESRISVGINKGIAEACSNGYCPKWSEIDKSIFSKVMLKNISTEAALEARDRVPLPQFHGLHESYDALHMKLATQMPPTAITHQIVSASAATEATSVVDLVNAARKQSEETELARTSKNMVTTQQEEKAKDVSGEESGNDNSRKEESQMDESEDAGGGQERTENENSESEDGSGDDGSGDDGSDSEEDSDEDSETDSDASSEEEGDQEIVRDKIVDEDGSGLACTVHLKLEQQASINKLNEMTAPELSDCLSSSLRKFLREKQLSSRSVRISGSSLLDTGDVKVKINAKTQASQQVVSESGWQPKLERILIGSPVPTYKIRMLNVKINKLKFRNPKEKSVIIRDLAHANPGINGVKPIIREISWCQCSLPLPRADAILIVEFQVLEHANQALSRGLHWQGKRHSCQRPEESFRLHRCGRCQDYGHLAHECSAPHRCGKCAGQHPTETCKSEKFKCVSCGGGHRAGRNSCPAKAKAIRSLDFKKETPSRATEAAAEAQEAPPTRIRHSISVARTQTETSMPSPVSLDADPAEDDIKSESHHPLPQADQTQDNYPDTAYLLKQIEDLRKVVLARETAMQPQSSGGTKRRAGEAFACGAEAESTNIAAKRIKQEQETREDSMGLYRQPSPYIVNRPQ